MTICGWKRNNKGRWGKYGSWLGSEVDLSIVLDFAERAVELLRTPTAIHGAWWQRDLNALLAECADAPETPLTLGEQVNNAYTDREAIRLLADEIDELKKRLP